MNKPHFLFLYFIATQTITPDAYFYTPVSWQLAYPHLGLHHIRKSDAARTVQRLPNQITAAENGVQAPVVDHLHQSKSCVLTPISFVLPDVSFSPP